MVDWAAASDQQGNCCLTKADWHFTSLCTQIGLELPQLDCFIMPKRRGGPASSVEPDEQFRIVALKAIKDFRDTDVESISFPATLNNRERAFVHQKCKLLGLNSKSHGVGESRKLVVTRKGIVGTKLMRTPTLTLRDGSLTRLRQHMERHPIRADDFTLRGSDSAGSATEGGRYSSSRKRHLLPATILNPSAADADGTLRPPNANSRRQWDASQASMAASAAYKRMMGVRRALPSWAARSDVVDALRRSNVVVVSGETGTGKSTQVPQFILDDPHMGPTASLVVTQPRRLSAIALAERVAAERGEEVGRSIGYNVRLDSCTSSATRCLFCTTGVILRRVTSDPALHGVSHLIIDEAHERDVNSDFLLAILRDVLPLRPDLRVVVMSATIHLQLFVDFFAARASHADLASGSAPAAAAMPAGFVDGDAAATSAAAGAISTGTASPATARPHCVFIPGSTHRVTRFFLADVLEQTGFLTAHRSRGRGGRHGSGSAAAADANLSDFAAALAAAEAADDGSGTLARDPAARFKCSQCGAAGFASVDEYAGHVATCFGPDQPGVGGSLPAQPAAVEAEAALAGASGAAEAGDGGDAAPAAVFVDPEAALASAATPVGGSSSTPAAATLSPHGLALPTGLRGRGSEGGGEELNVLVREYQSHRGDDDVRVDADLVAALVGHIYRSAGPGSAMWRERTAANGGRTPEMGAALVFLPGWEEISAVRAALQCDSLLGSESRAQILALHSAVPSREQRKVFKRPPAGVFKVVLSTNIAETSLTIDDSETD